MKRVIYSGAGLLAIAAAFLAFNIFASLLLTDARLDLTEQKLYTISKGTERVLAELPEPVELQLFFSDTLSKDLVALRNYARRVEEMLRAYEREADGKIKLTVIDPQPFSAEEDRAAELGLQAVPLNQGGDQVYLGLAGTNAQGNTQVIPFFPLDQEQFLEYEISRLVQSLATPEIPVVGLLTGLPMNGGFDVRTQQASPPWMVLENIRQMFHIESLRSDIDEIPAKVTVLMLVHPKQLPEQTLYAIDQFVLRGGKLLAFVDPLSEVDTGMGLMPGEEGSQGSGLDPLFAAWGIRMVPGKALADLAYALSVGVGGEGRSVRHPGWLSLPPRALDAEDVITASLETVTVASSGVLKRVKGAQTRVTPLLESSGYAMPLPVERFAGLTDPEQLMEDFEPHGQYYALAARVQGPAQSAFPEGIEGREVGLKQADNINVIVVADTDMLSDRMWVQVQDFFGQRVPQPFADNGTFVVNALDNLAGSEALISIRSRGRFARPFEVVDDLKREAEIRFSQTEQALQKRLAETEAQLAELQNPDPEQALELTTDQQAALQGFMQEKLNIRRELREVRYQLNADIDSLGRTLKFLNIVAVPVLLTLVVLGLWFWRRRRSA